MNRFPLSALVIALMVSSASASAEPSAVTEIFPNLPAALADAETICAVPADRNEYPCLGGNGAAEVYAVFSRIDNYLAAEPGCQGLTFSTKPSSSNHYLLEIEVGSLHENAPLKWWLWQPFGSSPIAGTGRDQPREMVRLICGIVKHQGARRVG